MTPLRQRMIDAMVQRGFAQRTQETCISAIRRMAKHYRRDPALYTPQEVQTYLLHMVKQDKLSYSSMNQAACAAQFLFQTVLGHGREQFTPHRDQAARQRLGTLFERRKRGRNQQQKPAFAAVTVYFWPKAWPTRSRMTASPAQRSAWLRWAGRSRYCPLASAG